jgi:hypothetical protein
LPGLLRSPGLTYSYFTSETVQITAPTTGVVRCGDNYLYFYSRARLRRAGPSGPSRTCPVGAASTWGCAETIARVPRRGRPGCRGSLAVAGGQLSPLPLARQRTGAGRCPHRRDPAPAASAATHRNAPRVAAPARAAGSSSRAGHPVAAKTPHQGRSGLRPPRPLLRRRRPLTEIFPGKIGAYREAEGVWDSTVGTAKRIGASWRWRETVPLSDGR